MSRRSIKPFDKLNFLANQSKVNNSQLFRKTAIGLYKGKSKCQKEGVSKKFEAIGSKQFARSLNPLDPIQYDKIKKNVFSP